MSAVLFGASTPVAKLLLGRHLARRHQGLCRRPVDLTIGLIVGAALPAPGPVAPAMLVGFFAYGVSLALFIAGMRHLGTARAGAYFSVAPFFSAALALALGETPTWPLLGAAVLMAVGVWLHLSEHHEHLHRHDPVTHAHEHSHDDSRVPARGLHTGSPKPAPYHSSTGRGADVGQRTPSRVHRT